MVPNDYSHNRFHQSEDLIALLQNRKTYLLRMERQLARAIGKAPSGTLRINRNKGYVEYYQRGTCENGNGLYLSKKNRDLTVRLGQKRYDEMARMAVCSELDLIDRFLSAYPKYPVEAVAESLPQELRELILPVEEDDDAFASRWQNTPYSGKEQWSDSRRFSTARGEVVRSKSELIIADELFRTNTPYRYECPVELKGMGTVYPDFTVLNVRLRKEILWEHRGMMDDPVYAEAAVRKMAAYTASGYLPGVGLVITEETSDLPLDTLLIRELIQTCFK